MASYVKQMLRWPRRVVDVLRGCDLIRFPDVKLEYELLGSEFASWAVALHLLKRESIVYSFGIGQNATFDLALIELKQLAVHGFDPTPRSIEWIKSQNFPSEFVVHEYGLSDTDGELTFYPPVQDNFTSFSAEQDHGASGEVIRLPVKRLSSIADELGHSHIDLVKMDIEGSEYGVISDILQGKLRPTQLLIEFHHRFPSFGAKATRDCLTLLRQHGYRAFHISNSGQEFSFVHEESSSA